jgi:hypothetical protein
MKSLGKLGRALLVTGTLALPALAAAEQPPKHDSAEKSAQKDKAKSDKATKSHKHDKKDAQKSP